MSSLNSLAKAIISEKYRPYIRELQTKYRQSIRDLQSFARELWLLGNQFTCPCCGGSFREFLPTGVITRQNAQCPRCFSLERHRLIWLYLKNKTNFFTDHLKVLHFAPENCFQNKFKAMPNLDYISTDLESPTAMVKMDITNISYEDNSFDVILCNHVLEHIPDDKKAMKELLRVLKPGGWAILLVPLDLSREKTFEDPSIVSPEERERFFGQRDHVRWYGQDYQHRLEQAGFTVTVDDYAKELGSELSKKYSLMEQEDIYFCTKSLSEK